MVRSSGVAEAATELSGYLMGRSSDQAIDGVRNSDDVPPIGSEHHPLDAVAAGWRSIIILRME